MSLRSKRESKDYNSNHVYVKIGKYEVWQDLLSLTVWDDSDNEYSIKTLLEKIFLLEEENSNLKENLEKSNENFTNALNTYVEANNQTEQWIAQAQDILALKVSALEAEVESLKEKTKYL